MRTITIVNQKGGCGKTTTAINLAAIYARRGLRTLLIDMDPQSHCAAGLGVPESRIEFTIGQAMLAEPAAVQPSSLVWEVSRNLHLAPSTMSLASLEAPGGGLHALPDKDRRLENLLAVIAPHYDRCLIDCSPTVGLLTFNALRASRETLIPVETGFFSLRGAAKQWNTIQRLIQHIGRPIACHMLATLHNPGSRLATNILNALRREFAGQLLPVVIREHEVLREAASFGQPVLEYAPDSEACRDFESLADWLEEHMIRPAVHIEVMRGTSEYAVSASGMFTPLHGSAGESRASSAPGMPASGIGASTPALAMPQGSRAAELARRVNDPRARGRAFDVASDSIAPSCSSELQTDLQPAGEGTTLSAAERLALAGRTLVPAEERPAAVAAQGDLFGARRVHGGVLFLQPLGDCRSMHIAGDFNSWSPDACPMRRNEEAGVFERIIELPPGRHHYRLVADGRWIADPYNPSQIVNTYGEPISIVDVDDEQSPDFAHNREDRNALSEQ